MGSGCVHEVDVVHIEERGHHVQLWEYLQQELFLTPDCIVKTIKKLLSPEVAHLADSYGVETAKGGKALCLAITEPGTYGLTARRSNRAELRRRYSALLPALYCVFNKVFATCPSKALVIYLTT
jgi:hypothetical protein